MLQLSIYGPRLSLLHREKFSSNLHSLSIAYVDFAKISVELGVLRKMRTLQRVALDFNTLHSFYQIDALSVLGSLTELSLGRNRGQLEFETIVPGRVFTSSPRVADDDDSNAVDTAEDDAQNNESGRDERCQSELRWKMHSNQICGVPLYRYVPRELCDLLRGLPMGFWCFFTSRNCLVGSYSEILVVCTRKWRFLELGDSNKEFA